MWELAPPRLSSLVVVLVAATALSPAQVTPSEAQTLPDLSHTWIHTAELTASSATAPDVALPTNPPDRWTIEFESVVGHVVTMPAGHDVWVALPDDHRVVRVSLDDGTRLATIDLPGRPARLALSADGLRLHAALDGAGGVAHIDTATSSLTGTTLVGDLMGSMEAVDVAEARAGLVIVAPAALGYAYAVAFDPDNPEGARRVGLQLWSGGSIVDARDDRLVLYVRGSTGRPWQFVDLSDSSAEPVTDGPTVNGVPFVVSPDGVTFMTPSARFELAPDGLRLGSVAEHGRWAYTRDGRTLIAFVQGVARRYSSSELQLEHSFPLPCRAGVGVVTDDAELVAGVHSSRLCVAEIPAEPLASLAGTSSPGSCVDVLADSKALLGLGVVATVEADDFGWWSTYVGPGAYIARAWDCQEGRLGARFPRRSVVSERPPTTASRPGIVDLHDGPPNDRATKAIRGVVRSQATGQPVAGIEVRVLDWWGVATPWAAITDAEGRWEVPGIEVLGSDNHAAVDLRLEFTDPAARFDRVFHTGVRLEEAVTPTREYAKIFEISMPPRTPHGGLEAPKPTLVPDAEINGRAIASAQHRTIQLEQHPEDLVVDEGRGLIYAAVRGARYVAVFSLQTLEEIDRIPFLGGPLDLAMVPGGDTLHVLVPTAGEIAHVDLTTRTVRAVTELPSRTVGSLLALSDERVLLHASHWVDDIVIGEPIVSAYDDAFFKTAIHRLGTSSRVLSVAQERWAVLDTTTRPPSVVTEVDRDEAYALKSAVSDDGSELILSTGEVYDTATFEQRPSLPANGRHPAVHGPDVVFQREYQLTFFHVATRTKQYVTATECVAPETVVMTSAFVLLAQDDLICRVERRPELGTIVGGNYYRWDLDQPQSPVCVDVLDTTAIALGRPAVVATTRIRQKTWAFQVAPGKYRIRGWDCRDGATGVYANPIFTPELVVTAGQVVDAGNNGDHGYPIVARIVDADSGLPVRGVEVTAYLDKLRVPARWRAASGHWGEFAIPGLPQGQAAYLRIHDPSGRYPDQWAHEDIYGPPGDYFLPRTTTSEADNLKTIRLSTGKDVVDPTDPEPPLDPDPPVEEEADQSSWPDGVTRVAGDDRYATAAALAARRWSGRPPTTAIITSGRDFPDALTAGPLGGRLDAPVLLATPDGLPIATRDQLRAMSLERIIIVGGPTSVGHEVEAELEALVGGNVTRFWGSDRYSTAAAVAASFPSTDALFAASGQTFADALAAGPAALRLGAPVALTAADAVPSALGDLLTSRSPTYPVVAGGPTTISDSVLHEIWALSGSRPTRVAGASRFSTAVALAPDHPVDTVYLATGRNYPDGLAAAAAAGADGAPVLLTEPDRLPAETTDALGRLAPRVVVLVGGPASISESVASEVRAILGA